VDTQTKLMLGLGAVAVGGGAYLYVKSRQTIPTDVDMGKKGGGARDIATAACVTAAAASGLVGPAAQMACSGASSIVMGSGKLVAKGGKTVGKLAVKGVVKGGKAAVSGIKKIGKVFGFGDAFGALPPPMRLSSTRRRVRPARLSPGLMARRRLQSAACGPGDCCEDLFTDRAYAAALARM
jgi:hypothetical protein